ncbi:uncharacterized protein PSFLO_01801 [Pseudozyma flocculosa]|uniref:Uncharacterized protein n=1 Tax=Pseudozyma flocculosa TaxID=84751 RepID=A0A5C3EWU0_9BASI|nr:uncharacterized protein PSFLO_01801 [Pseudozyma flocculosa]
MSNPSTPEQAGAECGEEESEASGEGRERAPREASGHGRGWLGRGWCEDLGVARPAAWNAPGQQQRSGDKGQGQSSSREGSTGRQAGQQRRLACNHARQPTNPAAGQAEQRRRSLARPPGWLCPSLGRLARSGLRSRQRRPPSFDPPPPYSSLGPLARPTQAKLLRPSRPATIPFISQLASILGCYFAVHQPTCLCWPTYLLLLWPPTSRPRQPTLLLLLPTTRPYHYCSSTSSATPQLAPEPPPPPPFAFRLCANHTARPLSGPLQASSLTCKPLGISRRSRSVPRYPHRRGQRQQHSSFPPSSLASA